jgi:hypothetical protein
VWGLCAFFAGPILPAYAQDNVVPLLEFTGQILNVDAKDRTRPGPCKTHAVELIKDRVYIVDLMSSDFDAYVRIEDNKGKSLAEDDDGGNGTNSRLRFTAPESGVFVFVATSCAGGVGNYQLTIRTVGAAVKLAAVAMPEPKAGQPARMAIVLNQNDPLDPERNQPAKIYTVKLQAGVNYQIDLMSRACDAFLRLEDPKGKKLAENDDGGDGNNSRLRFTPPEAGAYRLVATTLGLNNQFANLDLVVTETGKPLAVDPAKVFEVKGQNPLILEGTLKLADANDKVRQNCRAHVHKIKLQAGKTYVIDMVSAQVDCYLRLEDGKATQLAENDDGGEGTNSRIEFTPSADGEFRVVTTTCSDNEAGAYTLQVRHK